MKKHSKLLYVLVIIVLAIVLYFFLTPKYIIVQGEAETNRIDISSRIQGRVDQLNYDLGDNVKQGDLLLTFSSPSLLAREATAKAQLDVAIASRNAAYSTRPEQIQAQKAAFEKSESDLEHAKKSYTRIENLRAKDVVSKQQFDEMYNKYQAALRGRDIAKAQYELAMNGASVEAKALADAQVAQAQAGYELLQTDVAELEVITPINGQVVTRVAEKGQLYNPGTPLYSIVDLDNIWFNFNLREDMLAGLKVGDTFAVQVPSLDNRNIEVKIIAINALGQYANWRATKATGDFDLKTFQIRAKPIEAVAELRPGMSAISKWKQ